LIYAANDSSAALKIMEALQSEGHLDSIPEVAGLMV
jgi:hypothetical protein